MTREGKLGKAKHQLDDKLSQLVSDKTIDSYQIGKTVDGNILITAVVKTTTIYKDSSTQISRERL